MESRTLLLPIIAIVFVVIYLSTSRISPYDKTISVMTSLKVRIVHYAKISRVLPSNLNDIHEVQQDDSLRLDGWNRPIIYRHDNNTGEVTLISCGESGDCPTEDDNIIKSFQVDIVGQAGN
jgi:hypothetical protein